MSESTVIDDIPLGHIVCRSPFPDGQLMPCTDPRPGVALARVLSIAEKLIAAKGPEAVSMQDVAHATGYSVASLAAFFPTIRELQNMIQVHDATALLKQNQEVLTPSADAGIFSPF